MGKKVNIPELLQALQQEKNAAGQQDREAAQQAEAGLDAWNNFVVNIGNQIAKRKPRETGCLKC